jgi:hypothetical protein
MDILTLVDTILCSDIEKLEKECLPTDVVFLLNHPDASLVLKKKKRTRRKKKAVHKSVNLGTDSVENGVDTSHNVENNVTGRAEISVDMSCSVESDVDISHSVETKTGQTITLMCYDSSSIPDLCPWFKHFQACPFTTKLGSCPFAIHDKKVSGVRIDCV